MMVQNLRQDVTYALRQLRRNPGFAAVYIPPIARDKNAMDGAPGTRAVRGRETRRDL